MTYFCSTFVSVSHTLIYTHITQAKQRE